MSRILSFSWTRSRLWTAAVSGLGLVLVAFLLSGGAGLWGSSSAKAVGNSGGAHMGVASCAGSTCHGRIEADGPTVRQDELLRWQEPSSLTGAHSRAYAILLGRRSAEIARNLGLKSASSAPECLGCHADPAPTRGPRFQLIDGVGCEACHGGSENWLASHYTKGGSHAANVSRGLIPLENPKARANVCLDCHFGSADDGQFVTHRIMAAGHPRISFEMDLFSTLQQHHDEDADYAVRKGKTNNVRFWAVGQAMALKRSLDLYANPRRGTEGVFPEFYFFDCHSCHRKIYDQAEAVKTGMNNPGRPIPEGFPPYNDENIIMLLAAAKVAAPGQAAAFESASRSFHSALAGDRSQAVAAARRLSEAAGLLADSFSNRDMGSTDALAIVDTIASGAVSARFTDYEGSVQAVMAVDTLLNALVTNGTIARGSAAGIRANVNRAYEAVRDPNDYRPGDFRAALGNAARAIRSLR